MLDDLKLYWHLYQITSEVKFTSPMKSQCGIGITSINILALWDQHYLGEIIHSRGFIFTVHAWVLIQSCLTPCGPMDCKPIRLLCPWNSPGNDTGVGCQFPLQGIFQTEGSNLCLLQWQADSLPWSHLERPYFHCRETFKWVEMNCENCHNVERLNSLTPFSA